MLFCQYSLLFPPVRVVRIQQLYAVRRQLNTIKCVVDSLRSKTRLKLCVFYYSFSDTVVVVCTFALHMVRLNLHDISASNVCIYIASYFSRSYLSRFVLT